MPGSRQTGWRFSHINAKKRASPVNELASFSSYTCVQDYFRYAHVKNEKQNSESRELSKTKMADAKGKQRQNKTKPRKNFKWEPDMIENLIDCMLNYKSSMLYKNLDFNADKVGLYREVRLAMAELYKNEEEQHFGPPVGAVIANATNEKDFREATKRGLKRIQEKIKDIRQNFSKAVVSGSRSGSGKIVYEFYDKLITLWGGSANIEPLEFGVNGDSFDIPYDCEKSNREETVATSEISSSSNNNEIYSDNNHDDESSDDSFITQNSGENNEIDQQAASSRKRKENCIPQLIDNKRKHLERNLSAAQRDQLLFKEARDDSQFRKDMADAMRESTKSFTESIQSISKSMTDLGSGISRSIEMLAQAMLIQNSQPINQNQFYQHPPQSYTQMLNNPIFPQQQGNGNSENDTRK